MPASLADEVIDRLFSALTIRYGAPFLERWRDLDLKAVKGDWARELSGFANNLGALKYALDYLPEKPPTVIEFRKICNAAPQQFDHLQIGHKPAVRGPTPDERRALESLKGIFR